MSSINDLIEWNDSGSHYSLYVKHYVNDKGHTGLTMIFEDVTHQKVTEIVIPPRQFPVFLKAANVKQKYSNII